MSSAKLMPSESLAPTTAKRMLPCAAKGTDEASEDVVLYVSETRGTHLGIAGVARRKLAQDEVDVGRCFGLPERLQGVRVGVARVAQREGRVRTCFLAARRLTMSLFSHRARARWRKSYEGTNTTMPLGTTAEMLTIAWPSSSSCEVVVTSQSGSARAREAQEEEGRTSRSSLRRSNVKLNGMPVGPLLTANVETCSLGTTWPQEKVEKRSGAR